MRLTIPERKLTRPKRFVIEVAADGFNAYQQRPDKSFQLIAASPKAVTSDWRVWEDSVLPAVIKMVQAIHEAIAGQWEKVPIVCKKGR
ncbi:MAG: hypothetical protein ABSH44_17845 [Bryobacteraceae bacterium]|jgi:hypothetical protein